MKIKFVILSSLLICATYGFDLFNIFDDQKEISPQIDCTGVADSTKLPDDTDCGHFYLCDGGASLRLACRSTDPHFDRCKGICVNDMTVCTITDCGGSTQAPTEAPTPAPTEAPTLAPTDAPTPAPTEAPTQSTTYHPPTVPTECTIICNATDPGAANCGCIEQWKCINNQCVCDTTIQCILNPEDCATQCGCPERCDCVGDACSCKSDHESIQCPFDDLAGACVENCGCYGNCQCVTEASDCTCKDECACEEPPKVCPFKPTECSTICGCKERCLCNGLFCKCDLYHACP